MRVSTSQIYSIANIGMRDAQVAINNTTAQISSGKRVLSPSDDPVAATGILSLNQELSRNDQYKKNITAADNNLNLEETSLQSVVNLIQRFKEIAVNAGNTAVLTPADYKTLASEVDSNLDELLNLQNTRNSSGQYIFSGYQSQSIPFLNDGGGNYTYAGDEGQLRMQASATVTVATSDSGKRLFMDIPSAHNTFNTSANPTNKANPPAVISVGNIVDQAAFDKIFPGNMQVTFNAASAVVPPSSNFTVSDPVTGKIYIDRQVYVSGQDIVVNGAKFSISGSPSVGTPTTPATLPLGAFAATDFTAANSSVDITVGGITETFQLDQNITSVNDLITQLGGDSFYPNANPISTSASAQANHTKLLNLGLTLGPTGFTSASGLNITIKNGSATTNTVTGIATQAAGTTTTNGVLPTPGDSFLIKSTTNQSLLSTVARFSQAMKDVDTTQASKDNLSKLISDTLANLTNALNKVTSVQGEIGARQNMLDSTSQSNSDTALYGQTVLSQLQDVDFAEASTRLQMQTLVLSAAQQSFVKVSELSLFKYI